MIRCIALMLVCALPFSIGCGPDHDPTAKVTGKITVNGQPADGFTVLFTPTQGRPATGNTDSNGRFSLSTFETDDGAILGEHIVTIADAFPNGIPPMGPMAARASRVPHRYQSPATSPLKATVKDGEENDFGFDLKP